MKFSDYLNQAWRDHAQDALKVAHSFENGVALIENQDQIAQMSTLVCHVSGEHLGEWSQGVQTLEGLKKHSQLTPGSEIEKSIQRLIASLKVSAGDESALSPFTASEKIRVLATSASALADRNTVRAESLFKQALDLAGGSLEKNDPANRNLAVTGHNVACALEEKPTLNSEQKKMMLLAAQTSRKYWEIAGTWKEVERAEYRLTMSSLKAEDAPSALQHAKKCLEVCAANNAEALEFFFGYEALAKSEKALHNDSAFEKAVTQVKNYFVKLADNEKSWCKATLESLEKNT